MSMNDMILAVFLGSMLQAVTVTAVNYGLRKYHARKAAAKLGDALRQLQELYAARNTQVQGNEGPLN
jgi:hypothetical protein